MKLNIIIKCMLFLGLNVLFTSCPSSTEPAGNIILQGNVTIECTRTAVDGANLGTYYLIGGDLDGCNASLVGTNGDSIAIKLDSNMFIFRDLRTGDYKFNLDIGAGIRFSSDLFNISVTDTNKAFNFIGNKKIKSTIDSIGYPYPNPNSTANGFNINCMISQEQSFTLDLINLHGQSLIAPDTIRKYPAGLHSFTVTPSTQKGAMFICFRNDSLLAYTAVLKK